MRTFEDALIEAFQNELVKIAQEKQAALKLKPSHKTLGVAAAGAAGYETLRRANQDRKNGRMMRIQQGY